jgi:hypothetical protein
MAGKGWHAAALAVVLGAVIVGTGAAGTVAKTSASSLTGTWHVKPGLFPNAPWAKGGDTVTIQTTSQSAALPVISSAPQYADGHTLFCGATFEKPTEHPGATWFRLTYTWSGGGTMMGCSTTPAQGSSFYSGPKYASLSVVPGGLHGNWQSNWGDPKTSFPLDLTPGAADTGGGSTKTVSEPAPGATTTVVSPRPLPAGKAGVTVSDSAGTLSGTTLVAEGGFGTGKAFAEGVATCWLLGPSALPFDSKSLGEALDREADEQAAGDPRRYLAYCMLVVAVLAQEPARKPSSSAAAGCKVQRLAIGYRKGHVVSVRPAPAARATEARYACAASAGSLKIGIAGPTKAIGPRLDVGVVRSAKAPKRRAKLSFKYSW